MRTIYRLYYIFRDFSWQMTKKNIAAFAASTAFFLFLSMIPLLMALCAILPYTTLTEENLINAITQFTPDAMNALVISIVSDVYARSAGTITIFALVTIWSASKAMLALIHGLNAVNDFEERRNYFVLRSIACIYTVIILIAMILALFVMVFGNVIVNFLLADIPPLHSDAVCHAFSVPFFLGGTDAYLCIDLCLCAEQQDAFQGADSGSSLFSSYVECGIVYFRRIRGSFQRVRHIRRIDYGGYYDDLVLPAYVYSVDRGPH